MKKDRILILLMLSALFLIVFSEDLSAQSSRQLINLKGQWKFSIGDNREWSKNNYNDKDWEVIKVPSSWEDEGFHGYDGYAWYRKKIVIPSSAKNKSLTLKLGRIDDVDEVYFNGQLIGYSGSFFPDYSTAYNSWRRYSIPENLIRFDKENLIAVRVFDAELSGGILEGDQGIYQNLNWDINLERIWKFNTGDNSKWKEVGFDDSKWENINVPGFWEFQGFTDYDGYAWYRIKFFIPEKLRGKELVLLAGKIDDFDETYFNGRLVGSTGPINRIPKSMLNRDEWEMLRVYNISPSLLRFEKENTIAIRVYDGFVNGGIHLGPVAILTKENYSKYLKRINEENPGTFWERLWNSIFNN